MSRSSLTLAFVAGEQHQVVPCSRGVIGQRELQPELVEEGEAWQGGMRREGCVAELATAAEPGPGDIDGCKENTCPSVTGVDLDGIGGDQVWFITDSLTGYHKMALLLHITYSAAWVIFFSFQLYNMMTPFSNTITSSVLFYFH